MALLMPMLVVLIVSALDLGRAYFAYVGIVGAAEYGAQAGAALVSSRSLQPAEVLTRIPSIVATSAAPGGLTILTSEVTASFPDRDGSGTPLAGPGHAVRVDVVHSFSPATPLVNVFTSGQPIQLRATASTVAQ